MTIYKTVDHWLRVCSASSEILKGFDPNVLSHTEEPSVAFNPRRHTKGSQTQAHNVINTHLPFFDTCVKVMHGWIANI